MKRVVNGNLMKINITRNRSAAVSITEKKTQCSDLTARLIACTYGRKCSKLEMIKTTITYFHLSLNNACFKSDTVVTLCLLLWMVQSLKMSWTLAIVAMSSSILVLLVSPFHSFWYVMCAIDLEKLRAELLLWATVLKNVVRQNNKRRSKVKIWKNWKERIFIRRHTIYQTMMKNKQRSLKNKKNKSQKEKKEKRSSRTNFVIG